MNAELEAVVNKHIARKMVEATAKAVGPFDAELAQRVLDILNPSAPFLSSAPAANTPPQRRKGGGEPHPDAAGEKPDHACSECGVKVRKNAPGGLCKDCRPKK